MIRRRRPARHRLGWGLATLVLLRVLAPGATALLELSGPAEAAASEPAHCAHCHDDENHGDGCACPMCPTGSGGTGAVDDRPCFAPCGEGPAQATPPAKGQPNPEALLRVTARPPAGAEQVLPPDRGERAPAREAGPPDPVPKLALA